MFSKPNSVVRLQCHQLLMIANNIRKLLETFQEQYHFWLLLLLDSTVMLEVILKCCKISYDLLKYLTFIEFLYHWNYELWSRIMNYELCFMSRNDNLL